MNKGFMLAVQVGKIILGSLGQVHNGAQVDQFIGHRFNRGKLLGQQAQIIHIMGQWNSPFTSLKYCFLMIILLLQFNAIIPARRLQVHFHRVKKSQKSL